MGSVTFEWQTVNGGFPQGTISGPELFICMVSDLHTDIPDVKYMDVTTLIEIAKKQSGSNMQHATEQVQEWSCTNKLGINATKTNDMVISFGNKPDLHPMLLNGTTVEQVDQTKLLGVIIHSDLKWDANIHYINKKVAKRLHYIRSLKKAGLPTDELLRIYLSLVRTVWATYLTEELCEVLESIQR